MADAPFQIQAVWCGVAAGSDAPRVSVWPARKEAQRRFLVTNMPEFMGPLAAGADEETHVIDAAELHRIVFPENAASPLSELMRGEDGAKALWRLCDSCLSRLEVTPLWALQAVAAISSERDETALAALYSAIGAARPAQASSRWTDSFPSRVQKVERPALPPITDCEALDEDAVAALLGPGGALAQRVDGYEPRAGQIQMLRAVVSAFNGGRHLVAEAGTGTGKSLAYLLPAALWAKVNDVPVVVSTNTKNLQTQLVEKDLPAVLGMLDAYGGPSPEPLRTAVIKGRGNYLCLRRFGSMLESGQFELSRPELRLFAQTISWAAFTADGDLDALVGGASVDSQFLSSITCSSDECAGRACRHFRSCFVQKARERSLRANLIIANHSLVFTELGAEAPIAIPRHSQLIMDEAHNLEEAATNYFTQEFSPSRLAYILRRLVNRRGRKHSQGALLQLARRVENGSICASEPYKTAASEGIVAAIDATDSLREKAQQVFEALHPLCGNDGSARRYSFELPPGAGVDSFPVPPDDKWARVREAESGFIEAADKLVSAMTLLVDTIAKSRSEDELDLAAGDTADLSGALSLLTDFRNSAISVLSGTDDSYVYWVERAPGPASVAMASAAPLNVGDFLVENLFNKRDTIVLSSATLSVNGRFDYIASRLGLDKIENSRISVCTAPSPFDYPGQCRLVMPSFLPEPEAQDRSYVTELSDLIIRLADIYSGRTLCLFTSYRMMKECARLAEDALAARSIRLLVHGESGSRNLLTSIFRRDERCVLFGTQSFWEGVDVVGEALSCVVIARLPFVSMGDPVFSARCEQIEKQGRSSFASLSLPAAVLRLRQGFGRLIRHRDDRGSVIVADTRLVNKPYGRVFLASLPCPLSPFRSKEELLDMVKGLL